MTHPNFKVIDDCDIDGTHKNTPVQCKECGTVFCSNCAGSDETERLLCPGCGTDPNLINGICRECNGEHGYHDYPERKCPICGTIFNVACCGGKLFCFSKTSQAIRTKHEVLDKDSTICPSCSYPKCDFFIPEEKKVEEPVEEPETIADLFKGLEDTTNVKESDIFFDDEEEDDPYMEDDGDEDDVEDLYRDDD